MATSEEGETNPYAPPASGTGPDLLLSKGDLGEPQATLKKPASSRWAVVLMLFSFVVFTYVTVLSINRVGLPAHLDLYQQNLLNIATPLMRFLALGALLVGGRASFVYWAGCVGLASSLFDAVMTAYMTIQAALASSEAAGAISYLPVQAGVLSLLTWLWYSFTFGRPSRRYYRIA